MQNERHDAIRRSVRHTYATIAEKATSVTDTADETRQAGAASSRCCSSDSGSSCCPGSGEMDTAESISMGLGYSQAQVMEIPQGANMGLGCGNPQAIASLKEGERVLDLGSGGGFDAFLAARQVGASGSVIGVDMTPEMVSKARANAASSNFDSVEFRLGEIEHLPVADATIDVILSNCVINLSPEKPQVFREAFRVLKRGGRLAISDVVATAPMPEAWRNDPALHSGCMSGATMIEDLEEMLRAAGFLSIRIQPKDESRAFIRTWAPGIRIEEIVVAATIEAVKP
ncbi:MAG: arsenite methyltransferase [Magnetococcales bacterium]|nr:arsenite methyltransferase [Magnetococcales bacterium]